MSRGTRLQNYMIIIDTNAYRDLLDLKSWQLILDSPCRSAPAALCRRSPSRRELETAAIGPMEAFRQI